MNKPLIYVIGSLRNEHIPSIGNAIRSKGFEAFDDWHGAGPKADDEWFRYEKERGRSMRDALRGKAAQTIFNFDRTNLDRADAALLVLPAGKSGHLEAGYMIGQGKPVVVLFDAEPERWDVMYNFATDVVVKDVAEAIHVLRRAIDFRNAHPGSFEDYMRSRLQRMAASFGDSYEDMTREHLVAANHIPPRPDYARGDFVTANPRPRIDPCKEKEADDLMEKKGFVPPPPPPPPTTVSLGSLPRPFWRKDRP